MTNEDIEKGRVLFAAACDFVAGVDTLDRLPPPELPEVAFAGRSNVGKSSLINALTNRKGLARASNTPGRTQQLNFFNLGNRLMLVDLPGYGYAQASRDKAMSWNALAGEYLRARPCLRTVCVLVDGRHGFKDSDVQTLDYLRASGASCLVVATKTDKIKPSEALARQAEMEDLLKKYGNAHPVVIMTSSDRGEGLPALRAHLSGYAVEKKV